MALPEGPKAFEVTSELMSVRADADMDVVYLRLLNELRSALADPATQALHGEDLWKAVEPRLTGLSDAPIEQLARESTTKSFNLGRNLGAQRNRGSIGRVIRTEILDENTCPPCIGLDGFTTTVGSPEYWENFPPAKCEGRELGRCLYLYEAA